MENSKNIAKKRVQDIQFPTELTPRETILLLLILSGKSDEFIRKRLPHTSQKYVSRDLYLEIKRKLLRKIYYAFRHEKKIFLSSLNSKDRNILIDDIYQSFIIEIRKKNKQKNLEPKE